MLNFLMLVSAIALVGPGLIFDSHLALAQDSTFKFTNEQTGDFFIYVSVVETADTKGFDRTLSTYVNRSDGVIRFHRSEPDRRGIQNLTWQYYLSNSDQDAKSLISKQPAVTPPKGIGTIPLGEQRMDLISVLTKCGLDCIRIVNEVGALIKIANTLSTAPISPTSSLDGLIIIRSRYVEGQPLYAPWDSPERRAAGELARRERELVAKRSRVFDKINDVIAVMRALLKNPQN